MSAPRLSGTQKDSDNKRQGGDSLGGNQVAALQQQIQSLKDENEALKKGVNLLEKKSGGLQNRNKQLENEKEVLDKLCHQLRSEIDALRSEIDTLRSGGDTLRNERETLRSEINDLRSALRETEMRLNEEQEAHQATLNRPIPTPEIISQKELTVIKAFCDDAIFGHFVSVRYNVHHFNEIVSSISQAFLPNIVRRTQDVFQEELNHAYDHCKSIVGANLCDILIAESKKADDEHSGAAPNPLLVQAVLQMFLINFCVAELTPYSVCSIEVDNNEIFGDFLLFSRQHHPLQNQPRIPIPQSEFKKTLLRKFAALLRTAAWAIQGRDKRAAFEQEISTTLFEAKEQLRVSLEAAAPSTGLELSLVRETQLVEPFMEIAHEPNYSESSSRRGAPAVIGTVGLGLKKSGTTSGHGPAGVETWVKNVLRAQVVLDSTIGDAVLADSDVRTQERARN